MKPPVPIPEGARDSLRLAAVNLLEAKRHLVACLTTGGAVQWDECPEGMHIVGLVLSGTRGLHTHCTTLLGPTP